MIEILNCSQIYDGVPVLNNISCTVASGEIYGIIGPNGSGKSTLMRLISGVERPASGCVRINGKDVGSYSRRKLAQFMAVLEQEALPPVGFTVREVVEMGRYPHQDWLGRERRQEHGPEREGGRYSPSAQSLLQGIMERLDLEGLAERTLEQISGGERQRAALGKAMAQEPMLLLLDEPTTYLDIGYQMQMMDYVRKWNRECGLTVVAVLHDLNLAAQYCDRLMVISRGEAVAEGEPWSIMQAGLIEQVYKTRPVVVEHPETGAPQILLKPQAAAGDSKQPAGSGS
ncbi:MAG: yvrA [Paenibacillaceae bacterium]|jgi:iron complex transport system ATP-binding protein|nr:yvrA [Paenibacillaceae bacterium]